MDEQPWKFLLVFHARKLKGFILRALTEASRYCSISLYDRLRESALTHAEKGAFRSPADCMAEKNAFCILCHFERQAGIALVLPNRQYASKMQIKSSVQK